LATQENTTGQIDKFRLVMPLVRVMWMVDLSWEERQEVSMAIQRCLDDGINELVPLLNEVKQIGLNIEARTKSKQETNDEQSRDT